jgi:hypothetical protein
MNKQSIITAILVLALAFTFNACDSGGGGGGGGTGTSRGDDGGNNREEERKEYYKYYDPDDDRQRCVKGVVEEKCELPSGDVWFNPLTQHCCESESYDPISGTYTYTNTLGTRVRCGNYMIASNHDWEKCEGGVIKNKCNNGEWYNTNTEYCAYAGYDPMTNESKYEVKAMERCGNKYYEPEYNVCQGGVVGEMCGYGENAIFYNYETQYCDYDNYDNYTVIPRERCGNIYIYPKEERCNKGVVEIKCSGYMPSMEDKWYNEITQSCNWETGEVKERKKCG